jgi:hypothetical protein
VTTAAGLYRYDMSDIVEVVGYHERTPVLQFVQKANGIVSLTGEKLTETQVLAAVGDALAPELDPTAFVSAVVELVDEVPQAAFLVETAGIDDRAATDVIARLDRALGQRNVEYEEKRSSGRYRPPALRLLPVGELDRYRRRMTDAGRADGQFKILRLTADPAFASAFAVTREVGTGAAATAATVEVG